MGLIILDTSILIDHLRGNRAAVALIDEHLADGDQMGASLLTKVELIAGMRSHERRSVRTLVDRLGWVDVTDPIAEGAGALARRYARSHPGIGVVDFVIAATARELEATLWTHNIRHFPMFRGLKAPY